MLLLYVYIVIRVLIFGVVDMIAGNPTEGLNAKYEKLMETTEHLKEEVEHLKQRQSECFYFNFCPEAETRIKD